VKIVLASADLPERVGERLSQSGSEASKVGAYPERRSCWVSAATRYDKILEEGLLITSTADTSWNNFSITTVFLPVVKGFLDMPGSANEGRRNFIVGDTIAIDASAGADRAEVISPSGKRYVVDTGAALFENASEPGIYTVRESGKDLYKFSVNVDPRESNLMKLETAPEAPDAEITPGLVKVYRDIWRYFLWGAVMLFISEAAARAVFS
jgi:hypothetical protein